MQGPATEENVRAKGEVAAAISRRMVQLTSQYTGRGPTKARTTINTNLIVILLEDTLTKAERNLVEAGEGSSVVSMRTRFREIMRKEAVAMVEELSGRTVTSFMSATDPETAMGVEVFVLEGLPETGIVGVAESDGADSRLV